MNNITMEQSMDNGNKINNGNKSPDLRWRSSKNDPTARTGIMPSGIDSMGRTFWSFS